MSKKAKKRKRRRKLSTSSSDEDEKARKNNPETAKRRRVPSKDKNDVIVQKTEDHSSKKDEAQSTRHIKKPVYRLEKRQSSRRGQSPIFKEEEIKTKTKHSELHQKDNSSKNVKSATVSELCTVKTGPSNSFSTKKESKKHDNKSFKDRLDEPFSQKNLSTAKRDLLIPRSLSIGQKVDGQNKLNRKRRWDVPPQTVSFEIKEAKKPSPITRDLPGNTKNDLVKQSQHQRTQRDDLKTKMKSKILPAATLKESSMATISSLKTTTKASHAQQQQTQKVCTIIPPHPPPVLSNFKIPKKTIVAEKSAKDDKTTRTVTCPKPSKCEASPSNSNIRPIQQSSSSITVSSGLNIQKEDPRPAFLNNFTPVCHTDPSPQQDQMQVVEELYLARSEKRLEVNVMQSYGELTCMEIDPPEEGATDAQCKQVPQQDIIIVLDTNVLLSHLDYVKKIVSRGLEAVGLPVVLIPWVVLQEMDSLKKGRGLSGSVAHLAIPAISYIYNSLKGKESRLWGQSMQQAAESTNGLNAENNDDRVLQCCLQYQLLYPECAVILCTNDKNLCSKALLSGVKAFSKNDLETEVARSSQGFPFLQNNQTSALPHTRRSFSTLTPGKIRAAAEAQSQETTGLSVEKENNQLRRADETKRRSLELSSIVCEFESCLQGALSDALEAEMKAAYEDLWLEIVYIKPPWSLNDVLQCLKKHWIAVFGHVVTRTKLQNVLNLIEFFTSGKGVDYSSTLVALREAKDLLKEFVKSSSRVPGAISVVNGILSKLQTQGETTACDVVMKEDYEDKPSTSSQVSHSEVWALFEDIWDNVFQTSLKVFKVLDFDPNASLSVQPVGGPPPPREALACLDKLLCLVSQLLQAFSSVLSSAPGLAEVQTLLSVMQSSEIVNVDKVTATHLLLCFSQQEYRERLSVGGNQLMELKAALDRCVEFTGHHIPFTALP